MSNKDIRTVLEKHLENAYTELKEDRNLSNDIESIDALRLEAVIDDLVYVISNWVEPIVK